MSVSNGTNAVFSYSNAVKGAIVSALVVLLIDRVWSLSSGLLEAPTPVIMSSQASTFPVEIHIFPKTSTVRSTVSFGKNSYFLKWGNRNGLTGSGTLECYSLASEGAVPKGKFLLEDDFVRNQIILRVELNGGHKLERSLSKNE